MKPNTAELNKSDSYHRCYEHRSLPLNISLPKHHLGRLLWLLIWHELFTGVDVAFARQVPSKRNKARYGEKVQWQAFKRSKWKWVRLGVWTNRKDWRGLQLLKTQSILIREKVIKPLLQALRVTKFGSWSPITSSFDKIDAFNQCRL